MEKYWIGNPMLKPIISDDFIMDDTLMDDSLIYDKYTNTDIYKDVDTNNEDKNKQDKDKDKENVPLDKLEDVYNAPYNNNEKQKTFCDAFNECQYSINSKIDYVLTSIICFVTNTYEKEREEVFFD